MQKTAASQQFAAGILNDLNDQAAAKRREMIADKIRQDNLDKAQISAAMEKDDRLKDAEKKKEMERRRLGRQWMINAEEQYQKNLESAKNGANRGQKMTKEEKRYNKEVLKTVSQSKKEGKLSNVFEKCAQKKITNLE